MDFSLNPLHFQTSFSLLVSTLYSPSPLPNPGHPAWPPVTTVLAQILVELQLESSCVQQKIPRSPKTLRTLTGFWWTPKNPKGLRRTLPFSYMNPRVYTWTLTLYKNLNPKNFPKHQTLPKSNLNPWSIHILAFPKSQLNPQSFEINPKLF